MERRNFIRMFLAGSAAGIIAPKTVLASSEGGTGAGGLFYTKDAPGRWSKKVSGHLPIIKVTKSEKGVSLNVITGHEMNGYEHYIVKHVVLDKDFNFVMENMFDPMKDKAAISNFDPGNYQGTVNVLSVCNKHDTWLNVAEV